LAAAIVAAVFTWPLFDCQVAWETNQFVCGNGNEINIRWNYFWGCIGFGACVLAIVFVVFASYRVLFAVPRKNDITAEAFNRSRDQKVTQLAAQQAKERNSKITKIGEDRFGLVTPSSNPFAAPVPSSSLKFDLSGATAFASARDKTLPNKNTSDVVAASFVAVSEGDGEHTLLLSPQKMAIGTGIV
jgi:hypothetical protein